MLCCGEGVVALNEENKEWFAGKNQHPEEEIEEDDYSPFERRKTLFLKLVALFVVLVFVTFMLGNFLEIFTLPSLDFLVESQKLSRDPLVRELKQAVVRITAYPGAQAGPVAKQQRGTGFNIRAEGLIVTNRHLVEDADSLTVSFPGRESCKVAAWSVSPVADLALITLEGGDFPFVDLEKEILPAVGDQVMIIGNPLNYYRVAIYGEITGYWGLDHFPAPVLEIAAPIYRGSSGSPVFNREGKVVAVIYAALEGQEEEESRGLALPVALLEDYIASMEKEEDKDNF